MATEADEPGFLSRWSRRKTLQRQGAAPGEPVSPAAPAPAVTALATRQPVPPEGAAADLQPAAPAPEPPPAEPAPTLADVALLDRESNYARFVAPSVQPEVRNAALAKLFTDPHFNIMDRLDVYIDDYGKPDPLPAGMLRQMVQSRMLGLFKDEEADPKLASAPVPGPSPDTAPAPPLADAAALPPPSEPAIDENTDLQLQPDDGAGRPGPETGAGEHARQPH